MRKEAIPGKPRGRWPIANEGWPFIALCTGLLLVCLAWAPWWAAGGAAFLLALTVNFFRDPERNTPQGSGLFIAPADGKVVRAQEGEHGARVDIFMNIFDVHVNRAPMSGRITHMEYFPGRFLNASLEKASIHNERNRIEMVSDNGEPVCVTQIAGWVARRIVSYVAVGDHVSAGQRIGMIRFGSRVDCEIPAGYRLCVSQGDRVKAGETVLARKHDA